MIIYGLMKFIETIPERYDKMMNLLTFGFHAKSQKKIMQYIKPGMNILDVGCGTGSLSILCANTGANVIAADSSLQMLTILKKKIHDKSFGSKIKIVECGAGSLKQVLGNTKFDLIIFSFLLGELPEIVRHNALKHSSEMLDSNGCILVIDELWPSNLIAAFLYRILYILFFVPNFLLTRTMIRPVKNLNSDLYQNKLVVEERSHLFGRIITFLKIQKGIV